MLRVFPEHASRVRLFTLETPNEVVCHDHFRQPTLGSLGNKGPPASQLRAGRGGNFWDCAPANIHKPGYRPKCDA